MCPLRLCQVCQNLTKDAKNLLVAEDRLSRRGLAQDFGQRIQVQLGMLWKPPIVCASYPCPRAAFVRVKMTDAVGLPVCPSVRVRRSSFVSRFLLTHARTPSFGVDPSCLPSSLPSHPERYSEKGKAVVPAVLEGYGPAASPAARGTLGARQVDGEEDRPNAGASVWGRYNRVVSVCVYVCVFGLVFFLHFSLRLTDHEAGLARRDPGYLWMQPVACFKQPSHRAGIRVSPRR